LSAEARPNQIVMNSQKCLKINSRLNEIILLLTAAGYKIVLKIVFNVGSKAEPRPPIVSDCQSVKSKSGKIVLAVPRGKTYNYPSIFNAEIKAS
jgi:hypothetical protein